MDTTAIELAAKPISVLDKILRPVLAALAPKEDEIEDHKAGSTET